MSATKLVTILAVFGIGAFVLMSSIYTVSEVEQAIITQFGKPVGTPVTAAGLKIKLPFIQDVNPIDKRVLEWDGSPSDMPTKDKLYVSVDLFARWRIVDPLQYFLRLHDERSAQSRLDDILGSETRNAVAKHELIEIIRTTKDRVPLRDTLATDAGRELHVGSLVPIQKGRKVVEQEIFAEAAAKIRVFGMELLDIRFKRIITLISRIIEIIPWPLRRRPPQTPRMQTVENLFRQLLESLVTIVAFRRFKASLFLCFADCAETFDRRVKPRRVCARNCVETPQAGCCGLEPPAFPRDLPANNNAHAANNRLLVNIEAGDTLMHDFHCVLPRLPPAWGPHRKEL